MPPLVLLVDSAPRHWLPVLDRVVGQLGGQLEHCPALAAPPHALDTYDVVLLVVGGNTPVAEPIAHLREQAPEARVVIFAVVPHWKQARDAMLAGATYYDQKVADFVYLMTLLQPLFPPPGQPLQPGESVPDSGHPPPEPGGEAP